MKILAPERQDIILILWIKIKIDKGTLLFSYFQGRLVQIFLIQKLTFLNIFAFRYGLIATEDQKTCTKTVLG